MPDIAATFVPFQHGTVLANSTRCQVIRRRCRPLLNVVGYIAGCDSASAWWEGNVMAQWHVGTQVRLKTTGELYRTDSSVKDGRLWLTNSFDSLYAHADQVELAVKSGRYQAAKLKAYKFGNS
jgi:hypothetical protein